ncbi:MAG: tetratricopeptide repeat protein [FCB group bacterium]|nr:tetratricopeptide repeat protein [FCB group bacterium]
MSEFKKILVIIGIISIFGISLLAVSQDLSVQGNKNLRSANMHLGGNRPEKALPLYELVLEENPNQIDALNNIAAIYYDIQGDYIEAREYFIRLINVINSIYAEYEEIKQTDEKAANKFFKENIKKPKLEKMLESVIKFRDNCFTQLVNSGKLKIQSEEYNDAIEIFTNIAEIVPDSTITYRLIALCYEKLDDLENSRNYFIKTAELDPTDVYAKQQIASLYFNEEKFIESGNWYLEAAKNDAENPDNYYNAGIAYKNAGNDSLAYNAFKKVLELDPENISIAVTLSNIALSLKDNIASTMYLQKAVEIDLVDGTVDNTVYVTTLCYKLYGLKKFDELIKYGEMWRELNPLSKEAIQMLYNASKELNNKELMSKYEKLYNNSDVDKLFSLGLLKNFKIDINEAWVDPFIWASTDYDVKVNICTILAEKCKEKGLSNKISIMDNKTGKKISSYSNSAGYESHE